MLMDELDNASTPQSASAPDAKTKGSKVPLIAGGTIAAVVLAGIGFTIFNLLDDNKSPTTDVAEEQAVRSEAVRGGAANQATANQATANQATANQATAGQEVAPALIESVLIPDSTVFTVHIPSTADLQSFITNSIAQFEPTPMTAMASGVASSYLTEAEGAWLLLLSPQGGPALIPLSGQTASPAPNLRSMDYQGQMYFAAGPILSGSGTPTSIPDGDHLAHITLNIQEGFNQAATLPGPYQSVATKAQASPYTALQVTLDGTALSNFHLTATVEGTFADIRDKLEPSPNLHFHPYNAQHFGALAMRGDLGALIIHAWEQGAIQEIMKAGGNSPEGLETFLANFQEAKGRSLLDTLSTAIGNSLTISFGPETSQYTVGAANPPKLTKAFAAILASITNIAPVPLNGGGYRIDVPTEPVFINSESFAVTMTSPEPLTATYTNAGPFPWSGEPAVFAVDINVTKAQALTAAAGPQGMGLSNSSIHNVFLWGLAPTEDSWTFHLQVK
jgi:hypothetical protein